jgi:ribose transport system permease protein
MLLVGLIAWYALQCTPLGRRVYATGGNAAAARLAGVRTNIVIVGSLSACGAIAALSGSLVSAQLATGDSAIGPAYLLPRSPPPSSDRPSSAAAVTTYGVRCWPSTPST